MGGPFREFLTEVLSNYIQDAQSIMVSRLEVPRPIRDLKPQVCIF